MIDTLEDLDNAARTIYGEARGEGAAGMIAVAWVIRTRSERPCWWGKTVTKICHKPYQFSCWNEDDPNRPKIEALAIGSPSYLRALGIVCDVFNDQIPDPTNGATHYHHKSDVTPSWSVGRDGLVIGNHVFFNDIP
jgi:spore germination cell wall hydrolase CwlJ-like protein